MKVGESRTTWIIAGFTARSIDVIYEGDLDDGRAVYSHIGRTDPANPTDILTRGFTLDCDSLTGVFSSHSKALEELYNVERIRKYLVRANLRHIEKVNQLPKEEDATS